MLPADTREGRSVSAKQEPVQENDMPTNHPSVFCERVYQEESCIFWTGTNLAGLRAFSEWRVTRPERLKPHETAAIFCWWEGDFTTGIRRYQRRLSKALEF